ncbi:MAG: Nif3-like dinuclear metal center hexameric protein [Desulfamplus sp.]|nr:Nif3-like dinuclear metal center hexameric protein [Desulfamplus sp.]
MNVKEILSIINEIAPFMLSEDWDNCGLQAGNLSWSVKKILVALDVSMKVMEYARLSHFDLVVSHHPLMLRSPKNIDFQTMPGSAIAIAAQNKISIISAHTNLDKVQGGLNDHLANLIGLKNIKVLVLSPQLQFNGSCKKRECFEESDNKVKDTNCSQNNPSCNGLGRIGELSIDYSLKEFAIYIQKTLKINALRIIGNPDMLVKRVALCSGSGGSLIKDFFSSGADVYVTGDIKYHEARDIEEAGLGLIDVGHFASEQIAVDILCNKLKDKINGKGMNIEVQGFYLDSDPFVTLMDIF